MTGTDRTWGRIVGVTASLAIHVAAATAMWPARPIVPVSTGDGQALTTSQPTVPFENRRGAPTQLARARGSGFEAQGILALDSARARVEGVPIEHAHAA